MDLVVVHNRVLMWRNLLTRYRIDLANMDHQLLDFARSVYLEPGSSGTVFHRFSSSIPSGSRELIRDALQQIEDVMDQIDRSYSDLRSEMSIIDSRKSIAEAESVSKLTELAFIFIPLTFAASVFSMSIEELQKPAPLYKFVITAICFIVLAYSMGLITRSKGLIIVTDSIFRQARTAAGIREGDTLSTRAFLAWAPPTLGTLLIIGGRKIIHFVQILIP